MESGTGQREADRPDVHVNLRVGPHDGEQIIEQIAPILPIPQMVMRIDDRQIGLEDLLLAYMAPAPLPGPQEPERGRLRWHG